VNKICFFPEHVDILRDNRSDALGSAPTSSGYDPLLGGTFSFYSLPEAVVLKPIKRQASDILLRSKTGRTQDEIRASLEIKAEAPS
jgi:hypothetical protein